MAKLDGTAAAVVVIVINIQLRLAYETASWTI